MQILLAIDPGLRPGYVLLDLDTLIERRMAYSPELPLVLAVALRLEDLPEAAVTQIVVEGQHGPIPARRRRAVLTLANEAGWQLRRAAERWPSASIGVLHPQKMSDSDPPGWRDALRCTTTPKSVVQARVEASLLPPERALYPQSSATRRGDCLDATAIGWGAYAAGWTPWKNLP